MEAQQILPAFQLHVFLIQSLLPAQITWNFHHQLQGLQQCLEVGENQDSVPDPKQHRYERYYEWYYWREFSQTIVDKYPEAKHNGETFHFYAMLTFLKVTNQYLRFLRIL